MHWSQRYTWAPGQNLHIGKHGGSCLRKLKPNLRLYIATILKNSFIAHIPHFPLRTIYHISFHKQFTSHETWRKQNTDLFSKCRIGSCWNSGSTKAFPNSGAKLYSFSFAYSLLRPLGNFAFHNLLSEIVSFSLGSLYHFPDVCKCVFLFLCFSGVLLIVFVAGQKRKKQLWRYLYYLAW